MNPFEQQKPIPGIKHVILVASGKGGVGKSTVAANLSIALGEHAKVGLLDADIYGPSQPRMLGSLHQKPIVDEEQKILPIERYGVKLMSIGFLVPDDAAVVWRGPMLFKAIDQFLRDVRWGDLDYLVVDLPPGTGDVHLSLAQKVPVSGAIAVTTPQNISLVDVKKALDMFEKVKVPVLGVIENMAYFKAPGSTESIQLFPKGELDAYLDSKKLSKLAVVPFEPSVSLGSEAGIPVVESHPNSDAAIAFKSVATWILDHVK